MESLIARSDKRGFPHGFEYAETERACTVQVRAREQQGKFLTAKPDGHIPGAFDVLIQNARDLFQALIPKVMAPGIIIHRECDK